VGDEGRHLELFGHCHGPRRVADRQVIVG